MDGLAMARKAVRTPSNNWRRRTVASLSSHSAAVAGTQPATLGGVMLAPGIRLIEIAGARAPEEAHPKTSTRASNRSTRASPSPAVSPR